MGGPEDVGAEIESVLRRAGLRATPAQVAKLAAAQRARRDALEALRRWLDEVTGDERD